MGYAHYWNYPEKDTNAVKEGFARAKEIVQDIFRRHGQTLDGERLRDDIIWLDGPCETFVVRRSIEQAHAGKTGDPNAGFNFCKTAREAYDLPVCEALLALAYHVPGFTVSSDGFYLNFDYDEAHGIMGGLDENWPQAFANVREHYGIEFTFAIERTPCPHCGKPGKPVFYRKVIPTPRRKPVDDSAPAVAARD